MSDVLITVAICITQLILAYMGVQLALKPSAPEHHKYWIGGFLFVGLSGVLLTAWLTKHTGDAQERANREIHQAQVAATSANTEATNANGAAIDASKAATKANLAAIEASRAATSAEKETMAARGEAHQAQRRLLAQQREMIESFNGHLLPSDNMPALQDLGCYDAWMHPDGAYLIRIGEKTDVVRNFPYTPLSVSTRIEGGAILIHRHFITVSKGPDGLLIVSLDLRDKDDNIIVTLDENGFQVGPQFLKLHPDKSTLIVTDLRGGEVLKIVYAAKRYLWIRAKVIVNGDSITDTSSLGHYCLPANGDEGLELVQP